MLMHLKTTQVTFHFSWEQTAPTYFHPALEHKIPMNIFAIRLGTNVAWIYSIRLRNVWFSQVHYFCGLWWQCSFLQCYLFWCLIVQLCLIVQSVSNLRGRLPRRIETEAGEVSTLGQMGSIWNLAQAFIIWSPHIIFPLLLVCFGVGQRSERFE